MYLPKPSWGNHAKIFATAGMDVGARQSAPHPAYLLAAARRAPNDPSAPYMLQR